MQLLANGCLIAFSDSPATGVAWMLL